MGGFATGITKLPKKEKPKKTMTLSLGQRSDAPSAGPGGLGKAVSEMIKKKKPGQVLKGYIRGK